MKLLIIGLDCASPKLIFDWASELPNLKGLMDSGMYGPLLSTHPPITVPAWAVMMSGMDPGQLGYYGFRNRSGYNYDKYRIADSSLVTVNRAWDFISENDKYVVLLGVPQTYPVRPINGCVVSDFLTPSTESQYTYPAGLKEEVERVSGGYVLDVEDFRTDDKEPLLERIYEKTKKHFDVAEHLMSEKPWELFMMVEMGVDRIHHAFWSFMDPGHRKYVPGNPFENAIKDYYKYCDSRIGALLETAPSDTVVMVVSDHGARKMEGGVCINEWLIKEGLLVLKDYPDRITPLVQLDVDWEKTTAWGEGGYYGRLFINKKGREPMGVVEEGDYEGFRSQLKEKLESLGGPEGEISGTSAHRPEDLYLEVNGVAPDLAVYFGDLSWRSVGTVGHRSIYTFENDSGPDEANHDWQGVFILNQMGCELGGIEPGFKNGMEIYDVGPTVLDFFGLQGNVNARGQSMLTQKSQRFMGGVMGRLKGMLGS